MLIEMRQIWWSKYNSRFFLTATWLPHSQLRATLKEAASLTPMLITAFWFLVWPEGHRGLVKRLGPMRRFAWLKVLRSADLKVVQMQKTRHFEIFNDWIYMGSYHIPHRPVLLNVLVTMTMKIENCFFRFSQHCRKR